jgi:hypothetical protein
MIYYLIFLYLYFSMKKCTGLKAGLKALLQLKETVV